jgi:hypothetical protein
VGVGATVRPRSARRRCRPCTPRHVHRATATRGVSRGEWRQLARRVRHARTHLRPAGPHAPRRTRALVRALSPSVSRRCRRRKTAQWLCLWFKSFPAPRPLQHCTEWYDLTLQVFVLRLEPVVSATGRAAVDGYFPWSMRAGPALGRTHVLPFVFRKL